jgi:hypothetical protein
VAKKQPPVLVRIIFESDKGDLVCDNVIFKSVPLLPGMQKYCHLEKKGNQWLLLHTDGLLFESEPVDGEITISRDSTERVYRPIMILDDGRPLVVTRYTVMTPLTKNAAYYLDELDDHTFRIYHTTTFFEDKWTSPKEKEDWHRSMNKIRLEVITGMTKPVIVNEDTQVRSPSTILQQIRADREEELLLDDTI